MKKIILSLMVVTVAAVAGVAGTRAFFSDTETSVDNVFTAGSIDLKVDSECHYWWLTGFEGQDPVYTDQGCPVSALVDTDDNPETEPVSVPVGDWEETDLGGHKFFWFSDLKPGDRGEDTVSLHLIDNDGWLRLNIDGVVSDEVGACNEPETESGDSTCLNGDDGELLANMNFWVFLDDGATPGFQGKENDEGEGDNVQQANEVTLIQPGTVQDGETWNFWEGLAPYRAFLGSACNATDLDGDGHTASPTDACNGVAIDGRMVGGLTYYLGVAWEIPTSVGNEAQTDSISADMSFEVVQHRNNPLQDFGTP